MITFSSLRKQLTFRDMYITAFFSGKRSSEVPYWWRVITQTGRAYCWLKQISLSTRPIRSTTKIWVVTRHQHGNSVVSDVISRENQWWSPETLPKIAFLVLLKLTKKKMWYLRFLTGTVYAAIIDILNYESARKAAFHQHFHGKFCPESLKYCDWTIFHGTSAPCFIGNNNDPNNYILFFSLYLLIFLFTRRLLGR